PELPPRHRGDHRAGALPAALIVSPRREEDRLASLHVPDDTETPLQLAVEDHLGKQSPGREARTARRARWPPHRRATRGVQEDPGAPPAGAEPRAGDRGPPLRDRRSAPRPR